MWIRLKIGAILCCLAVATGTAISAQEVRVALMQREKILAWLKDIPSINDARSRYLMETFSSAGCLGDSNRIGPAKGSKLPNVICELPGEDPSKIIVIGAHYDKVKEGRGIVDNGTGAMLLPALFAALSKEPRQHTLLFIGFTDEEAGLVGSRAFVKSIPKEDRKRYLAMVNIDTLGLGPVTAWASRSNPYLLEWYERVAAALGRRDMIYVNVDKVGDSDSSPFKEARVPVIDFHSITTETFPVLHTKDDNETALKPDDYVNAYRTIANYVAYVDLMLLQTPDLNVKPAKKLK